MNMQDHTIMVHVVHMAALYFGVIRLLQGSLFFMFKSGGHRSVLCRELPDCEFNTLDCCFVLKYKRMRSEKQLRDN